MKGRFLPSCVIPKLAGLLMLGAFLPVGNAQPASARPAVPSSSAVAPPKDPAQELAVLFEKEENLTNTLGMVLVWLPDAKYRVAQLEVTQAVYEQVTGGNPSKSLGANRPVERVSCSEAVDFCRQLTDQEQKAGKLPKNYAYMLPTEAEWEYYVDDTPLSSAIVSLIGDRLGTEDAGLLPPNKLGLQDVRGNVWEWCSNAVARGGSYQSHEDYLSLAFRYVGTPDLKLEDIGFRVVLKQTRPS